MRRLAVVLFALVVLLPLVLVLAGGAIVNSGPVRQAIVESVQRATGHAVRIDGRAGLAWSLAPTVSIDGLVVLNPPGFSRAELATVRRVEARVVLLPLLRGRVEVRSVQAIGPDVLLERDAAGRGNWQAPAAPSVPGAPGGAPRERTAVDVQSIGIVDGRVAWRGAPPLVIPNLTVAPGGGPVLGQVVVGGVALAVSGTVAPAGFDVSATGSGLTLAAAGTAGAEPAAMVRFQAANLATAGALAGQVLPPIRDVIATGRITAAGPADLAVVTGGFDLGAAVPGLRLVRLEAKSAGIGQPIEGVVTGELGTLPLSATVALGGWTGTVPVRAQVAAQDATATVQGTADLVARTSDLMVSARVPNVQRLGGLAGVGLPALRDVSLDMRVLPAPGGAGTVLRAVRIGSAQGDLAGDLAVGSAPRPFLRGSLVSQSLDAAAWTTLPAAAPQPAPAAPSPAAPPGPPATAPGWLIPDHPLPFAVLTRADADLHVAVAQLKVHDALYRALDARLLLQDGRLRLDPAQVVSPGGMVQASVQADAGANPPSLAVVLRAPALEGAGLSAALGWPGALTGALDVDLDLRSTGATPHALAAALTGRFVLAMTEGDVENALLASVLAPALQGAGLGFDARGRSQVRCFGARFDVVKGQAAMPVLALDTTRLKLEGDGRFDLGQETMELHLRPVARVGPTTVAIPVTVAGPFRTPRAQVTRGGIAPGRFGLSIGGAAPDPCVGLAALRTPSNALPGATP